MRLRTTVVSLTAAAAMLTTPALAAHKPSHTPGKATAAGQICKSESKKKTMKGKGKSPFAACVIGVTRAEADRAKTPRVKSSPGQLCKDLSRKRSAADKAAGRKSPHTACVNAAAKVQQG